MIGVSLVLIVSALIFAMGMPYLVEGLVANSVSFGLPASNGIASFLAIIFGLLIASMIAAPFTPIVAKKFRKSKR